MESPQKAEQDTVSESTESIIAAEFDKMEAESDSELIEETKVDFEEEEGKEESTDVEAATDGDQEGDAEVASTEVDEELKEEVLEAAESDYNEPAPERWGKDIQDVYNSLPPQARKAMLEGIYKPMQRTYTQATQELAEMRGQVNPVLEAMNQYKGDFERTGVNPVEAFRTQMAWASYIQRVGAEKGIADMQAAYGVGKKDAPAGQEGYLTPTERAFKEQITALQNQMQGQQHQQQQTTQQNMQQQQDAFKNEIQQNLTTFINEKSDDGKLAHPHVEKVASNIAGIIRGGLIAKTDDYGQPVPMRDQLAQAYSMACNLDPSIRTPSVDVRQAERVKAAQKVGVVTKTPAGHVSTTDDMPIGNFIEKTWEEMNRKSA